MLLEPQIVEESVPPPSPPADRASEHAASVCDDVRTAVERVDSILMRRPRLVVLGEENAGKTALVNALLGDAVLPEAAVANTRVVTVVRHAAVPDVSVVVGDERRRLALDRLQDAAATGLRSLEIGLPVSRLTLHDIVDTPATCGLGEQPHVRLAWFDLPIWCTRAGQAWRESERRFWETLPCSVKQRAILAVTNADRLRDAQAVDRIRARLAGETAGQFCAIAFCGRVGDGAASEHDARFGVSELERAISDLLAARARRVERLARRIRARIVRHGSSPPSLDPSRPWATADGAADPAGGPDGAIPSVAVRTRTPQLS